MGSLFIYVIKFCSQSVLLFNRSVCICENQMISFWSLVCFDMLCHTLAETELDRYLKCLCSFGSMGTYGTMLKVQG